MSSRASGPPSSNNDSGTYRRSYATGRDQAYMDYQNRASQTAGDQAASVKFPHSEFKKPYLYDDHVDMEYDYSLPLKWTTPWWNSHFPDHPPGTIFVINKTTWTDQWDNYDYTGTGDTPTQPDAPNDPDANEPGYTRGCALVCFGGHNCTDIHCYPVLSSWLSEEQRNTADPARWLTQPMDMDGFHGATMKRHFPRVNHLVITPPDDDYFNDENFNKLSFYVLFRDGLWSSSGSAFAEAHECQVQATFYCDCENVIAMAWDPGNIYELAQSDSVIITILNGSPPFDISISGDDFWLNSSLNKTFITTSYRTFVVFTGSDACGNAVLNVEDNCNDFLDTQISSTAGSWDFTYNVGVSCLGTFTGNEYQYYAGGLCRVYKLCKTSPCPSYLTSAGAHGYCETELRADGCPGISNATWYTWEC